MTHRACGLILLLLLIVAPASARMREVPLPSRVDGATLIVEGQVVASTPFLEPTTQMIHTAHRIRVSRIFKSGGRSAGALGEIELITPGGRLGDEWHQVTPALRLTPGDSGLFFVDARADYAGRRSALVPFASEQGFVKYDATTPGGVAHDPFESYADVIEELHRPIEQRVGRPVHVLEDLAVPRADGTRAVATISGFNPTTVRAGVQELLTINGSGFGTFTGSAAIFFDSADDGPGGSFGNASSFHIQSWSDTQIQVFVPDQPVTAGTGRVIVRDSAGMDTVSPGDLTVQYALSEVVSGGLRRIRQEDENGQGGYTFQYGTSTANGGIDITTVPDAVARFGDALGTWNCSVGFNANASGTTTVAATGNDGVNVVTFDNAADPLPAGVLGRASSFFTGCGGDTWFLNGIDVRFRRNGTGGTVWYYGADPAGQGGGETDFLSVALHELGHAVQHGHINDPGDLMYYALTTGTSSRTLSSADVAGGQDIIAFSAGFNACGTTGTTAFNCTAPPQADFFGDPRATCGTSLTVDFTDQSLNGPTSWDWTFGDGGMSTATNPSHLYGAQGIYSVSLTATNANGSDTLTRDNYVVVTDAPTAAACSPTFAGHNSCCAVGIFSVTLNTIDNSTGTATDGDPLEEDFTCSELTVLETAASYPISITTGPANEEDVRVYIDWDGNGTLTAGELAFSSDFAFAHAGSIVPPANAVKNTALRMRVLSDFHPQDITSACENIEFGQVENYSVLVVDPVTAEPGVVPDDSLRVGKSTTPGLLDLTWGASCGGGATDYTIHEGTIGTWYSHTQKVCSTASASSFNGLSPGAGNHYYLVVPVSAAAEGSYGLSSAPSERPVSTSTCRPAQDASACP